MKKNKNALILIILVLMGSLIGGLIGELLSRYPYMAWLSLGGKNGYNDFFSFSLNTINLGIIKFGFNLSMRINVGSIIGMITGILIFVKK